MTGTKAEFDPRMSTSPEAAAEYFREASAEYVESFPAIDNGFNTTRIEQFVEQSGYQISPYVITTARDFEASLSKFSHHRGLAQDSAPTDYWAWFIPSYRVATVFSRPDLDAVNGIEYGESALVHELTHAGDDTYQLLPYKYRGITLFVERDTGLRKLAAGEWQGMLLDEMPAAYHQQRYLKAYSSLGLYKDASNDTARWPMLPEDTLTNFESVPLYPFACHREVAPKSDSSHTRLVGTFEGVPVVTRASAIAGSCLKLLTLADPDLEPLLMHGLRGAEAKQELAERFNTISSGLYDTLLPLDATKEDASFAAALVWNAVKSSL